MTAKKIILLTCVLVVASVGVAYASRKRKNKNINVTIKADSPSPGEGDAILKQGSKDQQNILRLQEALNQLHKSANYINKNCSGIKWGYMAGSFADGNIVKEDGKFDSRTADASQYYLNRKEVDLEYLNLIRKKIDKYNSMGNKCLYPLGIEV